MEQIKKALLEILGQNRVLFDEPMSAHTTFRTGGQADYFLMPKNAEEIHRSIALLKEKEIPFLVVGNGSNLLVGDKGIRGAVLHIGSAMAEITVAENRMKAGSGALLSTVSAKALELSLTGLEFASGIPGSVGGGTVMNAGAYGSEIRDVLEEVEILTEEGEVKTLSAEALALSYRHSIIPEKRYIVISAVFCMEKGAQDAIRGRMAELAEQRREKQPLQFPSAGSTFKRPEGHFAGKLIQDAGLKGKTIGGAQVSEKHAGFVINIGGATTEDILELIAFCQKKVWDQFGVKLETEVKFVGER